VKCEQACFLLQKQIPMPQPDAMTCPGKRDSSEISHIHALTALRFPMTINYQVHSEASISFID
jgi:hypothetical protein